MKKDHLKVIAIFGTIITIIIAVVALIISSNQQREKRANEELDKALEEVRKYNSEQQQKEAEEKLEMLHDVMNIDAQRGSE